ncbi:hypothetical protein BGZ73_000198, partial [Actinomortierella ambigua]
MPLLERRELHGKTVITDTYHGIPVNRGPNHYFSGNYNVEKDEESYEDGFGGIMAKLDATVQDGNTNVRLVDAIVARIGGNAQMMARVATIQEELFKAAN